MKRRKKMYEVSITTRFSAAHQLREFQGGCERLHGHNWKVQVTVGSATVDSTGLVMDFRELKRQTAKIIDILDHNFLNDLEPFQANNPSSENIARYVFDALSTLINNDRLTVRSVKTWESEDSCACYTGS
jgi:6-pyruvoyltetrahydropterin/6-carboxytetrahydropterin synthase